MIDLISMLFAILPAAAANKMENFEYSSCAQNACVMISAGEAVIGASQMNFTTSGRTVFRLTDKSGQGGRTFIGESSSFNPSLQTIVLDTEGGGFVLYSLRDGKLSDFRKRGRK